MAVLALALPLVAVGALVSIEEISPRDQGGESRFVYVDRLWGGGAVCFDGMLGDLCVLEVRNGERINGAGGTGGRVTEKEEG
eukprot:848544-Amorphochlora_amoeboformis.AAC.1